MTKENDAISVWMDKKDKEAFEEICKKLGFTVADVIKAFVKKVIQDKAIPFRVKPEKK
jgi:addiction module RelB/DinJ family antitoxin